MNYRDLQRQSLRELLEPSLLRTTPLHVGSPNLGDALRFRDRIDSAFKQRWLTNDGPFVREFEEKIATRLGVKHVVAMCNATVALEIASRALELTGEVIVPAFTFVATAHAIQWQQMTPVLCDIDPVTHNIDVDCAERLITPRTTGVVGVHCWGQPCEITALEKLCRRRRLRLLFDAAHAFTSSYQGRCIGGFGDAEIFSFHATKFVNSGEGGAVATNNETLANKMRLMRNFGFSGYDNVVYVGTNGKMNEMSAAMGLTSLESIDGFLAANKTNYGAYQEVLSGSPGISLLSFDEANTNSLQYVVASVVDEDCFLTRDQLLQVFHIHGVLARRYFFPGVHRMEPYRSHYPNSHLWLTCTERVASEVLVLPTGTAVDPKDIAHIGSVLRWAQDNAKKLALLLPAVVEPGKSLSSAIDATI